MTDQVTEAAVELPVVPDKWDGGEPTQGGWPIDPEFAPVEPVVEA